jgi:putative PEP-CTERM system TPR-repeat lipoprotein
LATAYIKNKQFEEAEKELDLLLIVNPEQPYVNQLKGAVRYQAKDFESAKVYTEKAIQNGLANVPNRAIAGLSAFRLGDFEQAFGHINIIKNELPADNPIQKLLIILQLKMGKIDAADEALDELDKLDGLTEDDVILLSAASTQFIKDGDFNRAREIAGKANRFDYSNPLNLAQKGMLLLSLENIEGITDLESALDIDSNLISGNTALARAYIKYGLFQKALDLSESWIAQTPQKVNGYILAAKANVGLNNKEEAEVLYQQVLELDLADPSANIFFADLNVEKGKSKVATGYLLNILDMYKDNVAALTKYFILMKELGEPQKGLDLIGDAYSDNMTSSTLQLLYAKALYTSGEYENLFSVFNKNVLNENTLDGIWTLLSNMQVKLKKLEKAEDILKKWLFLQPNNLNAHLQLILLNDVMNNSENAIILISQASQKFPNYQQFKVLNVYFYLKSESLPQAKVAFEQLPSNIKSSFIGKGFQGQILLLEGNFKKAAPLLEEYYTASPTYVNATLYAKALKNDNRINEAVIFIRTHIEQKGESVLAETQIAELLIVSENYDQAETSYRAILNVEPENGRALNNLAYLLIMKSEYTEALPFAEQAALLTPENPLVLDTLSRVLLNVGNISRALDYAEQAHSLDSSSNKLLVNLAEVLVISGNKPRALEKLALLPATTTEYKYKVEELMKQL